MTKKTDNETQRWEVIDAEITSKEFPERYEKENEYKYKKKEKPPPRFASFNRRTYAFVIDLIILGLINILISNLLGTSLWADIVRILISVGYFVWPYSNLGQTIGKRILGIRVVAIDGSPLNWRKGFLRCLGYIPSTFIFLFGFLWAILDEDWQAWHDKIAGTCVVHASVWMLDGHIERAEALRRQRKWLVIIGILPAILLLVGGSIFKKIGEDITKTKTAIESEIGGEVSINYRFENFPTWIEVVFVKPPQGDVNEAQIKQCATDLARKHFRYEFLGYDLSKVYVQRVDISLYPSSNFRWRMQEDTVKMRISIILVKTKPEAQKVLQKLGAGADFAELARQYSNMPGKEEGGDTGYFAPGDMMEELEFWSAKLSVMTLADDMTGHVKTRHIPINNVTSA